jgi:hypothetical protein
MKIRSVGSKLFHADGQTGMAKLIVAFRNFANAPKRHIICALQYSTRTSVVDVLVLVILGICNSQRMALWYRNIYVGVF